MSSPPKQPKYKGRHKFNKWTYKKPDPRRTKNIRLFREALQHSGSFPQPKLELEPQKTQPIYNSILSVVPLNCLTAIREARNRTSNCAVLNMANFTTPGGGVTHGSNAQEEFLCRVSNLYPALKKAQITGNYPLVDGFRHTGVSFFRDENYVDVEPNQVFQADVLTISALRLTPAQAAKGLTDEQITTIRGRIRQLLKLCIGYDIVVLSAFGCGAFQNPPNFVAGCFKEFLIDNDDFRGLIGHIIFAIIEDHNSQNNYQVFKEILDPE